MTMQIVAELQKLSPEDQMNAWANLSPEDQASVEAAWERSKGYGQEEAFNTGGVQGLTMGASEEIGGGLRQMIPGGEDYESYTAAQRQRQEDLQALYPGAYLSGDVAGSLTGAAVPVAGWVTGPARAARAASTAGKVAGTLGRGAIWGAADAGANAFGRGEGGWMQRGQEALQAAPMGAAAGIAAGATLGPLLSFVGSKWGQKARMAVEANLKKIADSEGQDMATILARVEAGETVAGMNDTTRAAARAIRNLNPKSGQAMLGTALDRRLAAETKAVDTTTQALVGPTRARAGNLYESEANRVLGAAEATGAALSGARRAAGEASDDLMGGLADAIQRNPDVARNLDSTFRSRGVAPLFDEAGNLRRMTVEEAEILYGELHDTAHTLFTGQGGLASSGRASALVDTYKPLRDLIDAEKGSVAAGLPGARAASAAALEAKNQGFPAGRGFLTTKPEPFARNPLDPVEKPGFLDMGPAAQDAARGGAATAIRARVPARASASTLMDEMLGGRIGGQNLTTMLGEDVMQGTVGPTVAAARNENLLVNALTGNSTTAAQLAAQGALTKGATLPGQLTEAVAQGPVQAAMNGLRHIVGGDLDLDDQELWELGKMMVASGPEGAEMIRKAMEGDNMATRAVRQGIRSLQRNATESILGRRGGVKAANAIVRGTEPGSLIDFMGLGAE